MELIDHFTLHCTSSVYKTATGRFDHSGDKIFRNRFMNKDVIWADASLTAIQKLATSELIYSVVKIRRLMYNGRALTTKLENTRN